MQDLTPAQEALVPKYVDKWLGIVKSNAPVNMKLAFEGIQEQCREVKLDPPRFCFGPVDCPLSTVEAVNLVLRAYYALAANKGPVTSEALANYKKTEMGLNESVSKTYPALFEMLWAQIETQLVGQTLKTYPTVYYSRTDVFVNLMYGAYEATWLAFYDWAYEETELYKGETPLKGLLQYAENAGWASILEDIVVIMKRPKAIHLDAQTRISNTEGPAFVFDSEFTTGLGNPSPSDVYAIENIKVDKKIVERKFTWQDIDAEQNAEVRRIMLNLYGWGEYVKNSGGVLIAEDEFGKLYEKPPRTRDANPIMVVEVVNSTKEPDGTYKNYLLRVDPAAYGGLKKCKSPARAAVASTWRTPDNSMVFAKPEDYILKEES